MFGNLHINSLWNLFSGYKAIANGILLIILISTNSFIYIISKQHTNFLSRTSHRNLDNGKLSRYTEDFDKPCFIIFL